MDRGSDRPLVVSATASRSAGEIHDLARRLGEGLAARGVEDGMLVGLRTGNGPAFLTGLLALRRCRTAAVLLEPSASAGEHLRTLQHLRVAFLLTAPPWADGRDAFRLERALPPDTEPRRVGIDVAVVKLTSGTTGQPRGITTPSEALMADDDQLARSMGLVADERILAAVPMSHSYGLSSVALPALVRGSTLVVPEAGSPFSGLQLARRCDITFLPTSPAFLTALVRTSSAPPLPPSLRRVISAGALLPPDTARAFRRRFGQPVHVFYGASECGGICYDRDGDAAENGTVGAPVEGVRVTIEPQQDGDATGLLVVESAAVAHGYLPHADSRLGHGQFRTGDLARWSAGAIELAGRVDDLINVRGRKVNPREVERVLLAHPAVLEAVAFKVEDGTAGERLRAIAACSPSTATREELLAWCRHHLAEFKVPRSLLIVDRLPRTERGKPDRAALLRLEPEDAASPRRSFA
ncbi:MAG: class I adenylate-forming enzyme family protein [Thermoanaerobaculia bacterium]